MKAVLLRQTLMICLVLFASAAQDVSKPKTSLRSIERSGNNHRHLSIWADFLSFVRCPPGPLGRGCHDNDSGSSGGSNSGDSDNDKDSGSSTDSGKSWYSKRSSGGDNSDASYTDNNDASDNGDVSSQQNAYYSNGRGGAGGGTAAASYLRNSTSWIAIIGGLALLATGIAVIMHKTVSCFTFFFFFFYNKYF